MHKRLERLAKKKGTPVTDLVEPHGLSLLRRSSFGCEGRAAVVPVESSATPRRSGSINCSKGIWSYWKACRNSSPLWQAGSRTARADRLSRLEGSADRNLSRHPKISWAHTSGGVT
jgi:hypothetical protein